MKNLVVEELTKTFSVPVIAKRGVVQRISNYFSPQYESKTVVDSLSFSVAPGECVGFVGPNGAGKSTTIKMLTGIIKPTSGKVQVLGKNPITERKKIVKKMSALFGQSSKLWLHLPVMESFTMLSAIYNIPQEEFRKQRDYLVDLFSIAPLLHKMVKKLSLGERMRCELVASFLHQPRIVFLDEPTIGLDITAKTIIRGLLRKMCKDLGTTLLLTSHDTDDIETVCDRMVLIKSGKLVVDDTIARVKEFYSAKKTITLVLAEAKPALVMEGVSVIKSSPFSVTYAVDCENISLSMVVSSFLNYYAVRDISIEGPSLETVIQSFYAKGF